METEAINAGVRRYERLSREAVCRGEGAALKPVERLMVHWFEVYKLAISEEKRSIGNGEPGYQRRAYGLPIMLVPTRKLAMIGMHTALSMCMSVPHGVTFTRLCIAIGRNVNAEYNLKPLRRDKDQWTKLCRRCKSRLKPEVVNQIAEQGQTGSRWPTKVHLQCGTTLMWLLIGVASAKPYSEDFEQAFTTGKVRLPSGKWAKSVRITAAVMDIIDAGHIVMSRMRPTFGPMIVPPMPWKKGQIGGYLRLKEPLVKRRTSSQGMQIHDADLDEIHKGINALGATAWRINSDIYEAITRVWEQGGNVAGVPKADDDPMPGPTTSTDPKKIAEHKKVRAKVWRRNAQLKSLRMEFLSKLNMARAYLEHKRIHFPHQLDFRGRAYPSPIYLNPHGDDLCRGLLTFADAKPIGERGIYWLKVHAANCYGVDKCSFDDRVAWVESHAALIEHIASSFPEGCRWKLPDKPWQFVAACIELVRINDNPKALSSLPIQMDGSCNGLQHYSALSGDAKGAASVNMVPSDTPSDIYTDVAKQAAEISKLSDAPIAKMLDGIIARKVVKQPVMTTVYNVTLIGARKQMMPHLIEAGVIEGQAYEAAKYLSVTVFEAMEKVCHGARQIMDWLAECAKALALENRAVQWTTPLGLPCEQNYRKSSRHVVRTLLGLLTINRRNESNRVKLRRQVNGFPPNFIHAVDGTHMLMTAAEMGELALAFAAVHDSFWTHACDIDRMHQVLREQFVRLHSQPIISNLYEELKQRYPDIDIPEPPDRGDFDLAQVLSSPYFFS